jgi:DNA-binding response OmpR family regulator
MMAAEKLRLAERSFSDVVKQLFRILVVEDEPELMASVRICLSGAGYRVLEAIDGRSGFELALKENPDLLLLDIMLPKLNGFDVCAELRRNQFDRPILMLTTRSEVNDRVKGLTLGADDYLAKPFDARELLARVHALLRRFHKQTPANQILRFGNVRVNLGTQSSSKSGKALGLTKTEYALLELLAATPGEPVTREEMLATIWGYTYLPNTRTVDTHIWRLRRKLGDDGDEPQWIKNVPAKGYFLTSECAEQCRDNTAA